MGAGIKIHDGIICNIIRTVFANNLGDNGAGGGLENYNSTTNLINCTFYNNSATLWGGSVLNWATNEDSSVIAAKNSIFWGDSASYVNEIYNYPYTGVAIDCVAYSCIEGGYKGTGNIDADPLFINPEEGKFQLLSGSPCIDAGDPESPFDSDGTIADMGAYCYLSGSIDDMAFKVPMKTHLLQNYPNPFNSRTWINYKISEDNHVRVTIYNLLGTEICTLVDKRQWAGLYSIEWNGKNNWGNKVPSGVYLYRLESGKVAISKKMILLK